MTQPEIQLFIELIRETVKNTLKEERAAIKEEMSKDMKEIKLLLVKVIKENKVIKETLLSENYQGAPQADLSLEKQSGLMEMVNGISPRRSPREIPEHLRVPNSKYRIPTWQEPTIQDQKIEEGVNALVKHVWINTNAKKLQNVLALTARDMNSPYDPLQELAQSVQPPVTEG